jgi:hypothetical protein
MSDGARHPSHGASVRSRSLDAETVALLATLLDGADSLVPFAEAVVHHLSANAPVEARDRIISEVGRVLRSVRDADEDLPVDALVGNHELLASFFQNTDLLDPDARETGIVARLVMNALERIEHVAG